MADFFNRLGHVEILSRRVVFPKKTFDIMESLEDIDYKFNIRKVCDMTTTNCEASVSILGLSRETIHRLATLRAVGPELQLRKRVRVYASYEDFGDNLIFDGDIVKAQPSTPPENWLNINAFVGNYRHSELYSMAVNDRLSIQQLMTNGAKILGVDKVEFRNASDAKVQAEMKRTLKGFDCSGTKYDLLQMLNRVSDFIVFEDNGRLICQLNTDDDYKRSRNTAAILSEDTGMIGIPEVLVGSAEGKGKKTASDSSGSSLRLSVKCFINPSIQLWDLVYLKSVYLPDADGYYTVNEIEYSGHLRGQDWYMTLTLTATNIGRT